MNSPERFVVAIGSFDGIHRGHAAVLQEVVKRSRALGTRSLVVTFAHPPRMVLKKIKTPQLLSSGLERRLLMKSLGIHEIRFLKFSKSFSKNTARLFFDDYLVKRFHAAGIVVGPDFRFGHRRAGDPVDLKKWGQEKIPLWSVKFAKILDHKLSSRHIRRLLKAGHLKKAEGQLGHRYFAFGKVVHGKGWGRRIGFPTANLVVEKGKVLPPGVYAVRVFTKNYRPFWFSRSGPVKRDVRQGLPGVCNIGTRPTLNPGQHSQSFEVHLLREPHPLYGRRLWVEFIAKLRKEKKFDSPEALKTQIRRDIRQAFDLFTRIKK